MNDDHHKCHSVDKYLRCPVYTKFLFLGMPFKVFKLTPKRLHLFHIHENNPEIFFRLVAYTGIFDFIFVKCKYAFKMQVCI